ncbi:globin family protein [Hyphobacterium sp. HN65]|uniref:Globin family protein n=1 Tax=Hyphobacterium lacteum TaxID=3116575 RepID=A0ABU7LR18_9PROT|nr:globin family protein [Hyphobacterium sp. HN65]MEE2526358.1 globin family protein [Hyphobacterium sp. HN65]
MEASVVRLVQSSFRKAAGLGEQVAVIFYRELFEIDPSLRPMFKGPMREQGKKLLATLAFVIQNLHAPDKVVGPAQDLGRKHVSYGVKARHYTLVGNALLRTLAKGLGDDFTPEVRAAWVSAYKLLADVMREAAYGSNWRQAA